MSEKFEDLATCAILGVSVGVGISIGLVTILSVYFRFVA